MVNRTQSVDETALVSLLDELAILSQAAKNVREKLLKITPVKYGSSLWWEKADKEAMEQIKAGRGTLISNKKELNSFFRKFGV